MGYTDFMRKQTEKDFLSRANYPIGMSEDTQEEIKAKYFYLFNYLVSLKEYYKTHKLHSNIEKREHGKVMHVRYVNSYKTTTQHKQHQLLTEITLIQKEVDRLSETIN